MMAEMKLSAAYILLAQKLQESGMAMRHEDIRTRLSDALRDSFQDTGNWCYVVAVFGDDKSGDVVYSCNSDLKKAAYTISGGTTTVAVDAAVDVQPLTTYETETAEVSEAGRRNSARDQKQLQAIHDGAMALGAACGAKESRVSGAGTPAYTGAAKASGSAGTCSTSESRESGSPQGDLGGGSSAVQGRETFNKSTVKLVESATTSDIIRVAESAKSDYEIKLIAPGKGSSAFYPAEVLKRDGPKVFKEGTHVYLNHPTLAEEAARPEGDVANLAGVLSSSAVYHENHKNGPGLYGRMKVFADHAQTVEEKAAHVGMSIRAAGVAEAGRTQDGVPILKELTAAESVDIVTRAGAGGMILTESAQAHAAVVRENRTTENPKQEAAMDAAELKTLNESVAAQAVLNTRLLERAVKADAKELATQILSGVTLAEASKTRVIDNLLREALPKTEAGELDTVKFTEAVNREAKREGEYVAELTGAGRVLGMGSGPGLVDADPVKAREARERAKIAAADEEADSIKIFESLGMTSAAAKLAAKGRAA